MVRLMEVPCRVLTGRGVAAADMAARLALPELDPARAFSQALLTGPRRSRRWEVGHPQVLEMFTRLRHGVLLPHYGSIPRATLRELGERLSVQSCSCPRSAPRWRRLSAPPAGRARSSGV